MEHAAHYRGLAAFLRAHSSIWLPSILQNWPSSRAAYPEAWIAWVLSLAEEDQRQFGDAQAVDGMPADLLALVSLAQSFIAIPETSEVWPLDPLDEQGLNLKKQHEIKRLLPVLSRERVDINHAVDIGGGMGHLARLCVKSFHWIFHSIDRDAVLQEKGRWWLKRSRGLDKEKLMFVNANFSEAPSAEDTLFARDYTLSIGLHTCGSLAWHQLKKSRQSKKIINFGCCYDKMDAAVDLNQSKVAQEEALPWSHAALFLATRSRKGMTREEFALLKRVNSFRFTLDLWLRAHYAERGFIIAGDAPKALYEGDFAHYAQNRMEQLGLTPHLTDEEWNEFFARPVVRDEAAAIYAAHLIRNLFARPLEIAILLDRALWVEEQGFRVRLLQVFDRVLSPRNIALLASR